MSLSNYFRILIDRKPVTLDPDTDVAITYEHEDSDDFQKKTSSTAVDIKLPASTVNDKIFNTFHDPSVEDMSPDTSFRSLRPFAVESNSSEILIGKCMLVSASHDCCPLKYQIDLYGSNGDWIIDLKDATLYDFLQQIKFTYSIATIEESWAFDGMSEDLPYVFAPVRYGMNMNGLGGPTYPQNLEDVVVDINMTPDYLKPSISVYWIFYWAFKSLGYQIKSDFFQTNYFRRLVMPWTWGPYLNTDGTTQDILKFVAKSVNQGGYTVRNNYTDYVDLVVSNDNSNGGFDNGNTYVYDTPNKAMTWTYPTTQDFGTLSTTFQCIIFYDGEIGGSSIAYAVVEWSLNGVHDVTKDQRLFNAHTGPDDGISETGITNVFATFTVNPGDVVSCKVYAFVVSTGSGGSSLRMAINQFDYEYSRIPLGGIIDWSNYIALKNYNILDFMAGIFDAFNISPATDPISKVVLLEPQYPYALQNDMSAKQGGYFNGNFLDWNEKQDLSKESVLSLFSDYERQLVFRFKDDSADGILKTMQDRYKTVLATGTYVLPDRFKTDIKYIENRFFSPVMHYEVTQWKYITGIAPQMIVMAPENISNTSKNEAQNTFQPKLAWYKGVTSGVGGWKFNRTDVSQFPWMFAVNYKIDGELDPVLSYSDERIATLTGWKVAKGLLKRFFWNRLAIMRNGQYYATFFYLNNIDVTNWFHREFIICRGQRWQLQTIDGFSSQIEQSTPSSLRKWAAVDNNDFINTFPGAANVLNATNLVPIVLSPYETKYYPLTGFSSDIPKTEAPVDLGGGVCIPIGDGSFDDFALPDATVGVPYDYIYFPSDVSTITSITPTDIPSWMTAILFGGTIEFSGTPDADGSFGVELDVSNDCSDGGLVGEINVNPAP